MQILFVIANLKEKIIITEFFFLLKKLKTKYFGLIIYIEDSLEFNIKLTGYMIDIIFYRGKKQVN